jgi:NAD(P)-dependent dehydrogenase (short-subunit alcohol dehydrogenase family)
MSDGDIRLDGRIAVVTGASRGIGRAVALELARAGAQVVAVARTTGGLEELDDEIRAAGGLPATLVTLDLRKGGDIDGLGQALFDRYKRVDILVGNAGVLGPVSPLGHVDPKRWDEVMAVNVTANWRLIRSFDPLFKLSDGPRAVFVTSGVSRSFKAYWGPYAVSKAALEALVRTYANEMRQTPLKVNLLSPGPLRTGMRAQGMPGEDPLTLKTPQDLAPHVLKMVDPALERSGDLYEFPTASWCSF